MVHLNFAIRVAHTGFGRYTNTVIQVFGSAFKNHDRHISIRTAIERYQGPRLLDPVAWTYGHAVSC